MNTWTDSLTDIGYAMAKTIQKNLLDLAYAVIVGPLSGKITNQLGANEFKGGQRLWSARNLVRMAPDGAYIEGPVQVGYAKYAIRKGLPLEEGQKTMGVENDPHTVDDFSGEITAGYGKGTKILLYGGEAVIKLNGNVKLGKVNIHVHDADKAGRHYDFVAEGIPPGTKEFEVNIPRGEFKGRYAFLRPEGFEPDQKLIVRMADKSVVLAKPSFIRRDEDKLEKYDLDKHIVEWKPDGSLANVLIDKNRAIFRSHRGEGEAYYDKLPAIEWLYNRSRLWTSRFLFPGPDQQGTILKGELFHPDGAARVGGILNAHPDKSIHIQQERGPVIIYAWDLVKLRNKNIHDLPYEQRRQMLEDVIKDIRRFNQNWHIVTIAEGGSVKDFYLSIVRDARGLPYSEGVVIKDKQSLPQDSWDKVKLRDTIDAKVLDILPGEGKRANTVGKMLVQTEGGGTGEVGSFKLNDQELKWIWKHRDVLRGEVAEIYVQDVTEKGAPRAGVFYRWHPSKAGPGLLMYTEVPTNDEEKGGKQ